MSSSNCCFLSCIQVFQEVTWSGISISIRIFHSSLWNIVKGFSTVNEAEVNIFLEFPWFFYDPAYVGNLISGSSAFSKSSLYIWKFSVHILLKPSLKGFEHCFASIWNEHNCTVVWTFFGIACLWDWNENWPFHWPVATAEFSKFAHILSAALSQHHLLGFEIVQLECQKVKNKQKATPIPIDLNFFFFWPLVWS